MDILTSFPNVSLMDCSPILLSASVFLIAVSWIRYLIYRSKKISFPIIGRPEDTDVRSLLEEGVAKYPDIPFTLPNNPPIVIVPKSALNDLKYFQDDKASFWDEIKNKFHSKVSGFVTDEKMLTSVVKNDVTRQIASSLNMVQEETAYSFQRAFGPCEEWTTCRLYPAIAKIVALVSNRVFVGHPLSRNEEWVDANINYTLHMNASKIAVLGWPEWIINIVAPYMKEFKTIEVFRNRAAELVKPLLEAHLARDEIKIGQKYQDHEEKSGVAWFLDRMKPEDRTDPKLLVNRLLDLSFVAIHTTSGTIAHAIFDLATYREYIPILLDEINSVIAEDGYDITLDGIFKMRKPSMPKFIKLDSFLKESMRMNPIFIGSHARRINSDVKFSSGFSLPKGSHIAIPSWVIHHESSALHLPGNTKPLCEFDGLRFYKLRQQPGNEHRHLSVSTSPDSLSFGYGNHACPGRFFANNEIKVILIELLRNWDFRFPGDVNMEGGIMRRPKNMFIDFDCMPNHGAMLEICRKKT